MSLLKTAASKAPFDSYPATLDFLNALDISVMKLGTHRIQAVLEHLGNPQDQVKTVHVVGTNGKGSTCVLLASIYNQAGYSTGLFSSPHLIDLRERIQVNRSWLPKQDFVAAAQTVYQAMINVLPAREDRLTYFEFLTAMAFWIFAQKPVDIAVIEAGLGGRLDSTHVMAKPQAVVITPISLDHTDRLGNTLEAIAREKAAVIRPEAKICMGFQPIEAEAVIRQMAHTAHAHVIPCEPTRFVPGDWVVKGQSTFRQITDPTTGTVFLSALLGQYQAQNIALAKTVIEALHHTLPVPETTFYAGVQSANWPGRYQYLPQQNLIIDGSHNEAGISALVSALQQDFPTVKILWGLTLLSNRDPALLLPLVNHPNTAGVYGLSGPDHRSFHPCEVLISTLKQRNPALQKCYCLSLTEFLQLPAGSNSLKILTGSLYTAGGALSALQHGKI